MSNYATIARQNWQTLAPSTYAQMQQEMNLDEHFQQIQEQAELMVQDLMFQYAGQDSPNESYLQKVGRLEAAKKRAEETVRQELLTPPQELWEQEVPEPMSEWEIQSEMLWNDQYLRDLKTSINSQYLSSEEPQEVEIRSANLAYQEKAAPYLERQQELQQMLESLKNNQ